MKLTHSELSIISGVLGNRGELRRMFALAKLREMERSDAMDALRKLRDNPKMTLYSVLTDRGESGVEGLLREIREA